MSVIPTPAKSTAAPSKGTFTHRLQWYAGLMTERYEVQLQLQALELQEDAKGAHKEHYGKLLERLETLNEQLRWVGVPNNTPSGSRGGS